MPVTFYLRQKSKTTDVAKATKAFRKRAEQFWYGAIGAFIQGVASVVAVHQDTGMSLASLFPAARKARVKTRLPSLAIKHDFTKRSSHFYGYRSDTGRYANRRIGERLGEKSLTITIAEKQLRFSFKFEIEVFQFMLNELGLGTVPALEAIAAGQFAMQNYIDLYKGMVLPTFDDIFNTDVEIK